MNVVFRTDSSIDIGSGHVMRCLALADELRLRGMAVAFICRDLPGNLRALIRTRGYPVTLLPHPDAGSVESYNDTRHSQWLGVHWKVDAEQTAAVLTKFPLPIHWMITDHYALDYKWESHLRPFVKNIMVIDDLADRPHECDLIVDQNLYNNASNRYDSLIPKSCEKLMGPQYALLRSEFREARRNHRKRDGSLRCIHVFLGGSDEANETAKVIQALIMLQRADIHVDVVVGGTNPHRKAIELLCKTVMNSTFHCQVDHMASLMMNADIAIGAGGTTSWERCCLGLPAIVTILGENQRELSYALQAYGAIVNLGDGRNVSPEDYYQAMSNLTPDHLCRMTELCLALVDGEGTIRVAGEIEKKVRIDGICKRNFPG